MRREDLTGAPAVLAAGILVLSVCGLLTSVPSSVVRLLQGDAGAAWASQTFKLTLAPMIVLACFGVVLLLARKTLKVDGLAVVLMCFAALATMVGIVGMVNGTNRISHAFNHLSSMGLMVGLYTFGLNLHRLPTRALRQGLDIYCGASLVVYGLSFIAFVFARSPGIGYWGFGIDVLLAVTWYVASGRPVAALAASALILLNGKRMYTVGWVIAAFLMVAFFRRTGGWRWMGTRVAIAACGLGIGSIGLVAALATGWIEVPHFVVETAEKWDLMANQVGHFDLDRGSAGRLTDMLRAWRFLEEDPQRWFVGGGVGLWWWDRGADYNQPLVAWQTHYTHFSPLNFVILAGLPMALIVFFAVAWRLFHTWRLLPSLGKARLPIVVALWTFVSARLVEGFLANLYFTDSSLWFAFGLMGAASEATRTAEVQSLPPPQTP